jgi:hypothetical protein
VQTSRVISDGGLQATATGLRIDVRLPWYRSLPLSTIEVAEVTINGETVDATRVSFELEGRRYDLATLPDQVDKVWYVLDSAFINVALDGAARGAEYRVSVTLNLYPPYIRGLKRVTRDSKLMRAH